MGISITIINMIGMTSFSSMAGFQPKLIRLAAIRDLPKFEALFWRAFTRACFIYVIGSLLFLGVFLCIQNTSFEARFLTFTQIIGLVIAVGLFYLSALLGAFWRLSFHEIFMLPFLFCTTFSALALGFAADRWGADGMILTLILLNGALFLPVSFFALHNFRMVWRSALR
jgi:hypothetical protein